MGVTTTKTNKPLNPRGNDQSPKGYNRAALYSGKALDFDGVNDSVTVPDDNSLDFTTAMSAFCYVRVDSLTSVDDYILSKYDYGNNKRGWVMLQDNGQLWVLISKNGLSGSTNAKFYKADVFLNTSDYYFVGFTFSSNVLKFYVNGQEVEANKHHDPEVNSIYTTDVNIGIGNGHFNGGIANYFNGKIANPRLFNTALTAAQVADLYNNPEKIVPTGVADSALKLWLPMMEGAGTTAYDGSGNGNHGTISGATWTHGIGAPVAQTAVIDWNKGENYVANSLEIINANFTDNQVSSVPGFEAPDGTLTASKITSLGASSYLAFNSVANNHKRAIYAKTVSGTGQMHLLTHNSNTNNLFDITNEWQKFTVDSVTSSIGETSFYLVDFRGSSTLSEILIWAPNSSTTNYNIVPTLSTAQTSPVLLPQGLTTGRDITGVNLFENVRKQGALNLDGNSWAEVHDNESLDFGTGSFTLEAWAKVKYVNQGSAVNAIFTLGGDSASNEAIYINSSPAVKFEYNGDTTGTGTETEGDWVHIVGTYDETNATLYLNGSQNAQTSRPAADVTNALVKQIGRDSTTFRYYNDQIAQPRIYNRALTAEEVQRNYDAGKNIYTND